MKRGLLALLTALLLTLAAAGLGEDALPQAVVDLCALAHPDGEIVSQSGWGDDTRGQFALALRAQEGYVLCVAEKEEGDAAYALTIDNDRAIPGGDPPHLTMDTDDSLFITQPEGTTGQTTRHSDKRDGVWGPVDIVSRYAWVDDTDMECYAGIAGGELILSSQRWDKDGNAVSEPKSRMSVPVDEGYIERFGLATFDYRSVNVYSGEVRAEPGLCAGLLEEGETLADLAVQSDCLLMLVDGADGTRRLRIADAGGGLRRTGPVPQTMLMDTFHMGDGQLFLSAGNDDLFCFARTQDQGWYLSCVQARDTFRITPLGIIDLEAPVSIMTNDAMRYGTHPWSLEITQLDLMHMPASWAEAMAQLDTSCYALVNNPNPADRLHLRTKPEKGAASLGKFYNRTPVLVLSVEGEWAHVYVGGVRGLEGYMMTKYLAMGGENPQVKCAFETLFIVEEVETVPLLDAPDRRNGRVVCDLTADQDYLIVGVVGEDWLVIMMRDGTVGYALRELFFEGNG